MASTKDAACAGSVRLDAVPWTASGRLPSSASTAAPRVRGGRELGHPGDGLLVGKASRVHHYRVEPGVEATQRLLERVRLVEEQGDRHAGAAGDLAAEGA